jgi:hypothetical protein
MTSPLAELVPRGQAVADITARIVDRDAFVVSVPPAALATAADRLAAIPGCTWYADNGTSGVLRLTTEALPVVAVFEALLPGATAAVAIVPKTVRAADLAAVLGHPIPADGSQDLVMLQDSDAVINWPALLVAALDRASPGFAARLAANDLRSLS